MKKPTLTQLTCIAALIALAWIVAMNFRTGNVGLHKVAKPVVLVDRCKVVGEAD